MPSSCHSMATKARQDDVEALLPFASGLFWALG